MKVINAFKRTGFPLMTASRNKDSAGGAAGQGVVETLYDVALDPSRYETLIDAWEMRFLPLLQREREVVAEFRNAIVEGHVERAGQVLDLGVEKNTDDPLHELLTSLLPMAAFVVGRGGRIRRANVAAGEVFGDIYGATTRELPCDELQLQEFEDATWEIFNGRTREKFVRCQLLESGRLVVFKLSALPVGDHGEPLVLVLSTELVWPEVLSETMIETFALTNAEVDVVRAIVEGLSVAEIAASRDRSVQTVRGQLRAVLAKTGTKSQSELLRLTLNLMDISPDARASDMPRFGESGGSNNAPVAIQSITRPDDRIFSYLVLGDPDGKPILYLPGNYGLVRWPASAEKRLANEGVRLIVPLKAGFGSSTSLPSDVDRTAKTVEDIAALLDHLGVGKLPVIAYALDLYNAVRLSTAYPARVTAVINCGFGFPVRNAMQYKRMDKWHRFIHTNARYAPKVFPFLVKAGFSLAQRIGKRGFVEIVHGSAKGDRLVLNDPENFEALMTGTALCHLDAANVQDAFAREFMAQAYDWSALIEKCDVPLISFVGLQDQAVSAETLAEIKADFKNVEMVEDAEAGELILFTRWRDVLDKALSYLEA